MLKAAEKAYCLALEALKRRDYRQADQMLQQASGFFADNEEFRLLRETTRLLVAVKEELGSSASEGVKTSELYIEEVMTYGEKDELR